MPTIFSALSIQIAALRCFTVLLSSTQIGFNPPHTPTPEECIQFISYDIVSCHVAL